MILHSECGDSFLPRTQGAKEKEEEIRNDASEIRVGDGAHLTMLFFPVITAMKGEGSPLAWPENEPLV